MGSEERKKREQENIRKKIIAAGRKIIFHEGYESLSIRKIANAIEYTPGIVYHYFKDKQDIVNCIVDEGYSEILKQLKEVSIDQENPINTLQQMMEKYIGLMMDRPQEFRTFLLNDVEGTGDKINILEKGISKKRETIKILSFIIGAGIKKGQFRETDPELTAQIFWTSTHGLISRFIIEKNIPGEQKKRLTEHLLLILLNGIKKE